MQQHFVQHLPFTARRVIAALVLLTAFLVMASIFSPDRTRAGSIVPRPAIARRIMVPAPIHPASAMPEDEEHDAPSTDPHEGLRSIGELESNDFTVRIYSTDQGPRYSIYQKSDGKLVGALLTPRQVELLVPEFQLHETDFSADADDPGPLMLADPK